MHVQATLRIDASNGGLGTMSDAATDHIPQVNVVRCVLALLAAMLVYRALSPVHTTIPRPLWAINHTAHV